MFEKGNFVVNTNNGICQIEDIVTMNLSGKDKEYYLLVPTNEKTAKVYIPVDLAEKRLRFVMNEDEVWELIKGIKDIEEAYVENDKEREKIYKEAISSCDPKQLISIIKTLYLRKQAREEAGKKNTAVDERYFKLAENHLHSEISFVLGIDKSEVENLIIQHI